MAHTSGTITNRRFILAGAVVVWLLFLASFLMPVANDIVGWQAYWGYAKQMFDLPEYWRGIQNEPLRLLLSSIFTWTNGTTFLAPVILFLWGRWSGWVGGALVLGGLVPCIVFFQSIMEKDLLIGFYCWVISIFLMAFLCFAEWARQRRIRRPQRSSSSH